MRPALRAAPGGVGLDRRRHARAVERDVLVEALGELVVGGRDALIVLDAVDRDLLGAEPECGASGVEGHVAAADDDDVPAHVDRLAETIPHYLPRHLVRPGMTGWAQVNGLRGGEALEQRVQHDIYYIENWSPWLDLQILLLTLVRWRNAN